MTRRLALLSTLFLVAATGTATGVAAASPQAISHPITHRNTHQAGGGVTRASDHTTVRATASMTSRVGQGAAAATFGTALRGSTPTGHGPAATAYDPSTDTIYVANGFSPNKVPNPGGNTVSVIDGRRCDAATVAGCRGPWPTITVGNEPSTIAVDPTHHTLYVGNNTDATVSVVDVRHCQGRDSSGCHAVATVPVAPGTWGMHVDPVQHTLYVAGFDSNTVSLIDTAACNGAKPDACPAAPVPSFATSDGPGDVDVNQLTHTAYVATLLGFDAFDTRSCNATVRTGCGTLGSFPVCDGCYGPFGARVDESTNTIYEGDGDQRVVAVDGRSCNADSLTRCATAPFGTVDLRGPGFAHVLGLVVDEGRHSVYVLSHKDDNVFVINTALCNGSHRDGCASLTPDAVHTGTNPQGIALDERTHTAYVANQNDDDLSVIDAARCSGLDRSGCRRLPVRVQVDAPAGVAVSERAHTAYVATGGSQVTMLDVRTCNISHATSCAGPHASVTVGDDPRAIAVDEARHTAYVANAGGTVSVLDTGRCAAHQTGCLVTATLAVPQGRPDDVAVNPTTGTVYVAAGKAAGTDVVVAFDATTCNATTTTGCHQAGGVLPLGPASNCGDPRVTSRLALGLDPKTDTVYAAQIPCDESVTADSIQVFDARRCHTGDLSGCHGPVASIRVGEDPFGLAVDGATRTLYAPLLGNGELNGAVAVIDIRTCNGTVTRGCDQLAPRAPAGFGSLGVAIDDRTHDVYVTNEEDASVSVIHGLTCRAGQTGRCTPQQLPTDDYPGGWLALAPSVGTTYVASPSQGTVSILPMRHQ
jgi:DNA-binding beta-propeller fold protein YncE